MMGHDGACPSNQPSKRLGMIDKNRRCRYVFCVEGKSMRCPAQQLQNSGDALGSGGRIKAHQSHRRARTEDGDHDRFFFDRIHEDVIAVTQMIESIELHFADTPGEFAGGRKRAGSERRDHGHVHYLHIAALRNDITAAVNHYGQIGLGFFQKFTEHAIKRRYIFDCENRDRVHAGSLWVSGALGSTGITTGNSAPWAAWLCLLNLWSKTCETALSVANTFCPVFEITSKLCNRFFRLFKAYSM